MRVGSRHFLFLVAVSWAAALCATVVVAGSDDDNDSLAREIEATMLREFDAASENLQPPKRGELVGDVDLTGTWSSPRGMDSVSFVFEPEVEGRYKVHFSASGCLAHWEFQRTAVYDGGVITLDAPVQEYVPVTYTRLFVLRIDGDIKMIASAHVGWFDELQLGQAYLADMHLLSRAETDGGAFER